MVDVTAELIHLLIFDVVEAMLTDREKGRLINGEWTLIAVRAVKVTIIMTSVPCGRKRWRRVRIPEERAHFMVRLQEHKAEGVVERVLLYHDKNRKI